MFGMSLPAFVLRQLYRKGSLESSASAFGFELCNPLMDATVVGVKEVKVGDTVFPLTEVTFDKHGDVRSAAEVSPDQPVDFPKGSRVKVTVKGYRLDAGTYPLRFVIDTEEFGRLKIEADDELR